MVANSLYFFKRIIYQLKHRYGFQIGIYRTTEITDLKTGRKTITRIKISVRRAIILPNNLFRDFSGSGLGRLNSDFQLGGLLDASQRTIIIDAAVLPRDFEFNPNDYIIFKHRRYNIAKVSEMEVADYIQLDVKETEGEPLFEIHEEHFRHKLTMVDESTIGE